METTKRRYRSNPYLFFGIYTKLLDRFGDTFNRDDLLNFTDQFIKIFKAFDKKSDAYEQLDEVMQDEDIFTSILHNPFSQLEHYFCPDTDEGFGDLRRHEQLKAFL